MNFLNSVKMFFNSPAKLVSSLKTGGRLNASIVVILLASAFNGFAAPVFYYLAHRDEFKVMLDLPKMVLVFVFSILTYLLACITLTLVSKLAGCAVSLRSVAATWGISYIPTLLCSAAVTVYECTFYYFIGNTLLLLLLNTVFILLLIWKAIFYFIEARVVLGLKGWKLAAATIIAGMVFAVLIFADMKLGLMVPML